MFQKLYPLLFFLFIGVIIAQDAPPTDTEAQQNIEASEDPNAAPEEYIDWVIEECVLDM